MYITLSICKGGSTSFAPVYVTLFFSLSIIHSVFTYVLWLIVFTFYLYGVISLYGWTVCPFS